MVAAKNRVISLVYSESSLGTWKNENKQQYIEYLMKWAASDVIIILSLLSENGREC